MREDLQSRNMPICGWTDYDPIMGTTHDLVSNLGLNPLVSFLLLFLWFHHLVPNGP